MYIDEVKLPINFIIFDYYSKKPLLGVRPCLISFYRLGISDFEKNLDNR